jgi:hypothetical protein
MEQRCLTSIMEFGVFHSASPYCCDGRFSVPLNGVTPVLVLPPDKKFVIAPPCLLLFPSHDKRTHLRCRIERNS